MLCSASPTEVDNVRRKMYQLNATGYAACLQLQYQYNESNGNVAELETFRFIVMLVAHLYYIFMLTRTSNQSCVLWML